MPPILHPEAREWKYIVLNRRYKPIGFNTKEFLKYEDYPILLEIKGLNAEKASKISYAKDPNTDAIYLYNDGCIPTSSAKNMKDHLERLAILSKLKIT